MDSKESTASDVSMLSDQVRDVHLGLISLSSMIETRNLQSDRLQGSTHFDINVLRQDYKDLEQKLDNAISNIRHDLEVLRAGSSANAHSIEEMLRVVQELRAPVHEMVALRSRVGGLILGLGVLGSVTVWLAEPIYRWFVEHHFTR